MSCSLNSLKGEGNIGDYIGDHYRGVFRGDIRRLD